MTCLLQVHTSLTFLDGGISLRVHAQHEVAAGQVAPHIGMAALLLTHSSILLQCMAVQWL